MHIWGKYNHFLGITVVLRQTQLCCGQTQCFYGKYSHIWGTYCVICRKKKCFLFFKKVSSLTNTVTFIENKVVLEANTVIFRALFLLAIKVIFKGKEGIP